jgi:hypothetical protein
MRNALLMALMALLAAALAAGTMSCEAAENDVSSGDSDSDSDSDSDNDSDVDSDSDSDSDSDAWDTDHNCDCPDVEGELAQHYCEAMNMCPEFDFIVSAETSSSHPDGPTVGSEVLPSQGSNDCLVAQHGCQMYVLSTGLVGNPNPNMAQGMGADDLVGSGTTDPIPDYQGTSPSGGPDGELICDLNQIKLVLEAPTGAEGFSFDFLFASAEYPEWINMGYNDTFYAILEHGDYNGGSTTNISFDGNGDEIEVDVNFFENSSYPCNENGSGWEPSMDSGSTGWLRTTHPVAGGDTFGLTFSIHDEGDCVWDSAVFIDNFQWLGEPVVNETTPIE